MLKLIYFVPESHLEQTKNAIFDAGAGGMGDYKNCAWQVKGVGQFQPTQNAQPFLGQINQLERVETIVPEYLAKQVKMALNEAHPYEEPAFEFLHIVDIK